MIRNASKVLSTKELGDVDKSTLGLVLRDARLQLQSELEVFQAAHQWAVNECERRQVETSGSNMREVLGDIIKSIRFLTLMPEEFSESPVVSGILTSDEITTIYMWFNSGGTVPPPDTLSDICSHRLNSEQTLQTPSILLMSRGTVKVQRVSDIFASVLVRGLWNVQETFTCQESAHLIGVVLGAQERRETTEPPSICENDDMKIELIKDYVVETSASYTDTVTASYTSNKKWGCEIHVNFDKQVALKSNDQFTVIIETSDDRWYPQFYNSLENRGPFQPERLGNKGLVVGFIYT